MKDLFFSELRRFRLVALIAMLAHLLILLFLNRMTDLLQQAYFESVPFFAFYLVLGLALALVQVGSYRKPSQWLWLMHRPLSTSKIFGALALSALTLLVIVMLLPMLVLVLGTDLFTSKVVDARHYMTAVHLLAFAMMAWLAGAHACVSHHKAAIAVLAAPILLSMHLISVWWLLLPVSLALLWLGWITLKSFRANRDAPVQGNITLLLTALPLQFGFFLLVFELGSFLFVTGSIMAGTDPLNTEYPPKGGVIESLRAEPNKAMVLALEGSEDERAESWRQQLPLMEPLRLYPSVHRFPLRHQLSNLNVPTQWYDETRNIFWTFSHDRMLFHGRNPQNGSDHGWWGVNGTGDLTPFSEVPFALHEGYLMTRSALYAIDEDSNRPHELLRLAQGEQFVNIPERRFNRMFLLTNQRVLAYRDDRQAVSAYAPPILDWQLPLPDGVAQLEFVDIAELLDGWLVSTMYGEGHRQIGFNQFHHYAMPFQQVLYVDDEGRASLVYEREIHRDHSPLQQVDWWFSPLLHLLAEWPDSVLDKGLTWPLKADALPDVPVFYPVAIGLMLASFIIAVLWLRRVPMNATRRYVWLINCALLGVPALLALICLEPRRARA
ncbi:hypothetical protein [Permianibacter aggregans]|uniref:Uncharacterized protein n=1 Tax=Permianibacter aggregans TaxID=1510150 RepID=A0A4V3D5X9_9GAMM|nr:hypothetical protein [Permianibacter aggregans]QGX40718.1 hypothetical protein E2H98_14030 [Permianibacter aggregans]TDQ41837.1 hypothetical protein EV696_13710 [Permianibacter aggregans]